MLFSCILSIFALNLFLLMTLFYAAINGDSVSFFRFPFQNPVKGISGAVFKVCHLQYPYSCFYCHFCPLEFYCGFSVCPKVISIVIVVTGCRTQPLFALFLHILRIPDLQHTHNPQSLWVLFLLRFLEHFSGLVWRYQFSLVHLSFSIVFCNNCLEYLTKRAVQVFIS